MALDELGRDDLDLFLAHIGEGSRPKLERMKEVDSFLEDKRVRCHQVGFYSNAVVVTVVGSRW